MCISISHHNLPSPKSLFPYHSVPTRQVLAVFSPLICSYKFQTETVALLPSCIKRNCTNTLNMEAEKAVFCMVLHYHPLLLQMDPAPDILVLF